jgi:hypothetical protein
MQIEANPCRLHCGSLCNPPTKKLAKMRPIRTRHIIRCGGQASSPTATRVYIGTRRPQYRQFISSSYHCAALPPSFLFRYRRVIGARRAGLRSLDPSCPYTGQGLSCFFVKCCRDCSLNVFFPLHRCLRIFDGLLRLLSCYC